MFSSPWNKKSPPARRQKHRSKDRPTTTAKSTDRIVGATESFILQYSKLPLLFSIPHLTEINAAAINNFVQQASLKV